MFMWTYDGVTTEKENIDGDEMSGLDDDDTLSPTGTLHIHESFADRIIEDYNTFHHRVSMVMLITINRIPHLPGASYDRVTTFHS